MLKSKRVPQWESNSDKPELFYLAPGKVVFITGHQLLVIIVVSERAIERSFGEIK